MTNAAEPASLTLAIEESDGVALVRCHGKLVAGVTGVLYSQVSPLFAAHKRIVLDFTDLTRMDSLGLGTVVRLYVSAKSAGCALELINLGKGIQQILGVTNLLSVLTVIGENGIRIL
jgi:anti-sigma B factor antagonist